MSKLQKYLDQKNFWNKLTGKPELNVATLTAEQARNVFDMLDCDLSPENLHCDGEISRSAAKAKYTLFVGAQKELKKLGFDYITA